LFTRLPATNISQIKDFTPRAWAKAKANEQPVAQAALTLLKYIIRIIKILASTY
jgi:hypothetical protein